MISAKNKIIISVFVFIMAVALTVIFVLLPAFLSIKEKANDLTNQEASLALLEAQVNAFHNFQDENSILQQNLALIKKSFVPSDAPIDFMEFLEGQAALFELNLTVSALPAVQTDQYSLAFNLSFEGDYANGMRFLDSLEVSPWLLEMTDLTINRYAGKTNTTSRSSKPTDQDLFSMEEGDAIFSLVVKAFAESFAPPTNTKPNNADDSKS